MAELHTIARELASRLADLDKKQLQLNEIVECAERFYGDPVAGVAELVESCSRSSPLYVPKRPMWQVLGEEYAWMAP